jgi:hypothetical protein
MIIVETNRRDNVNSGRWSVEGGGCAAAPELVGRIGRGINEVKPPIHEPVRGTGNHADS